MMTDDPPSGAQFAMMMERLSGALDDIKEIKGHQKATTEMVSAMVAIQKDVNYVGEQAKALSALREQDHKEIIELQKREAINARWGKWSMFLASVVLSFVAWAFNKANDFAERTTASMSRLDRRLTQQELIVGSRQIEQSLNDERKRK